MTLEKKTTEQDAGGQPKDVWVALHPVMAHMRPLGGREAVETGRQVSEVSHVMDMRYSPDVKAEHRFSDNQGRVFNIVKVLNVEERNRDLIVDCIERT